MEVTHAFVVAALLTATPPANCAIPQKRIINTTFISDHPIEQLKLGSNTSCLCIVKETPYFRDGNNVTLYMRLLLDTAWVQIVSGVSPNPRYKVEKLDQEVDNRELRYRLSIQNFQAADVGVYSCNVTPPNTKDILGTFSDAIWLSIDTSSPSVSPSNAASQSASSTTAAPVIALVHWLWLFLVELGLFASGEPGVYRCRR